MPTRNACHWCRLRIWVRSSALVAFLAIGLSLSLFGAEEAKGHSRPRTVVVSKSLKDLKPFVGRTVAEFVDSLGLKLEACAFCDEPPEILSAISFASTVAGERFVVALEFDKAYFSGDRKWKSAVVRRARIVGISTEKIE